MEPKKKTSTSKNEWNTPREKQNEYSKPKDTVPRKDEKDPKKDPKKDQKPYPNAPREKQNEFQHPKKVIAKPVDSKKINDKKTGSSGKKNPHTPSSKERIY